jgi:ribosomal protein S18 acetylase RimI-like enzyme
LIARCENDGVSTENLYELVPTAPTVDEYMTLRRDSGLTPRSREQSEGAVHNSWSFCHVRARNGDAVAMGRVIGDGGWYFVIADMATLPAHQRRGLGRRVIDHLLDDIRSRAPKCAYVTLTADAAGQRLYEEVGFSNVAPAQAGMSMKLPS